MCFPEAQDKWLFKKKDSTKPRDHQQDNGRNKLWSTHTVEYYKVVKIQLLATIGVRLRNLMLGEKANPRNLPAQCGNSKRCLQILCHPTLPKVETTSFLLNDSQI